MPDLCLCQNFKVIAEALLKLLHSTTCSTKWWHVGVSDHVTSCTQMPIALLANDVRLRKLQMS